MNLRLLGVGLWVCAVGCGSPPASQSAESAPKPAAAVKTVSSGVEPPLADLRTGALTPERAPQPLELEPLARFTGPEFETLKFRFSGQRQVRLDSEDVVDVPGATLAFVGDDLGSN